MTTSNYDILLSLCDSSDWRINRAGFQVLAWLRLLPTTQRNVLEGLPCHWVRNLQQTIVGVCRDYSRSVDLPDHIRVIRLLSEFESAYLK